MNASRCSLALALLFVTSLSGSLMPKADGVEVPTTHKPLEYPLGFLDGTAEHAYGESVLRIKTMGKASPLAAAKLQVGDEIFGVKVGDMAVDFLPDDDKYDSGANGPLRTLGLAIDSAAGKRGLLELHVRSGGKEGWVKVQMVAGGSFGPDYPFKCLKSDRMFLGSCDWLLKRQAPSGALSGKTSGSTEPLTAMMGLAFLCRPEPRFALAALRVAKFFEKGMAQPEKRTGWEACNWDLAWAGIFLAEFNWRYPDAGRKAVLQAICNELGRRVSKDGPGAGTYFHGPESCYDGNGLNIVGTAVTWCFSCAAKGSGVKVDPAAWKLAFEYQTKKSCGLDAGSKAHYVTYNAWSFGYNPKTGRGMDGFDQEQAAGRTGNCVQMLLNEGSPESVKLAESMGRFLLAHSNRSTSSHACSLVGIVPASAAIWRTLGKPGYRQHMEEWRWYMSLMLQPDGSCRYVYGKKIADGDDYMGHDNVANCIAALMLAAPTRQLMMFGAGKPNTPASLPGETPGDYPGDKPVGDKPAAGDEAPAPVPVAKPIEVELAELYGVNLDGLKMKDLGSAIVDAHQAIGEGRYSKALQRLDGLLKGSKAPAEKVKQLAVAMQGYSYTQGLIPQLDLIEEDLAHGEALQAVRRYDQFKENFPYGPQVKDRLQAILARIESPDVRAEAIAGRELEQLMLNLSIHPNVGINRQRMVEFAAKHAKSPYGERARMALEAADNAGGAKPKSP